METQSTPKRFLVQWIAFVTANTPMPSYLKNAI